MAFCVKRGLVLSAMLVGASGSFAAGKYGMAGCGLGSLVIAPSGNQSSAASTNGTGYQPSGITSGTSNCKNEAGLAIQMKQEDFIATNLHSLSKEMSQGTGESLAAFTETLGCSQGAFASVASQLKANHGVIFKAPGAMAVLDSTKDVLKSDPLTNAQCLYLN
ncbi:MAG: DUF3015 family protein [Proteobacteria bacterium]|nr:DUF3015 family protein [Pseudomonadota bacterium]